jgi:RimJ/RimL family protein N-acetyltransferase
MTLTNLAQTTLFNVELRIKDVRARLDQHLLWWLGGLPAPGDGQLNVIETRNEPGWDGKVRPVQGVTGPEGSVLAVPPELAGLFAASTAAEVFADAAAEDGHGRLEKRLGVPVGYGMPVFRWSEAAADGPDSGQWIDRSDERLPEWLRPFNGGVLALFDGDDQYVAGVGLKRHNDIAFELSVGTDPEFRGQGFATDLVAQAARTVIAAGGLPIYQHGDGNEASAKVADAAGFPDRGWFMLEIHPGSGGTVRG